MLHNRDLNEVSWEQREMEGDPRFPTSQRVPEFPYAAYAELLGLRGIRVDSPDQVGKAWHEAFHADRPVVVEAVVSRASTRPTTAHRPPRPRTVPTTVPVRDVTAFRGGGGGYRTGMDDITGAGPEEEAVRAGEAKPATEQEEGLGEPDSSSPDDQRDDPTTSEDDRDDS
ncbi:thiamine pyrophosphate-dependent enzyme [Actinosynnema sp. NPDC059797]